MKRAIIIFSLFFTPAVFAQVSFRTIVPQQPVVAGESFQVQYILEGADKTAVISPPVFRNFRLISGPNIYTGTVSTTAGSQPVRNYVYTLEAPKPGRFFIPGAIITFNERMIKSNEAFVDVVLQQEAARVLNKKGEWVSADYFLRPGEDPYQKIRQNLFLKVQVDRRNCYVGEPVLATFKLYSRLESKTDIVKNPGFYGFTVYDVVGLADKEVASEKINGKIFDVHTIRKVQLYPLQSGKYTIDPLEVKNRVEFSRSVVYKKTEQEISEGVLGSGAEEPVEEGTAVFETVTMTEPLTVEVRSLPEKAKPAVFSGAVGRFTIISKLPGSGLAKNEQGFLEVTLAGKGNFTQLNAPVIQWPKGVEGFEPAVKDELDKTGTPLNGSRTFRFPFVCASPGQYTFPPVSFSYFDTDSNAYKTISTDSIQFEVSNRVIKAPEPEKTHTSFARQNENAARVGAGIAVLIVLMILLYWIFNKKDKKIIPPEIPGVRPAFSAGHLLEPVQMALATNDDRMFFKTLQSAIWDFAARQFGMSGSEMNKQELSARMDKLLMDPSHSKAILQALEHCEKGIFTNASIDIDKKQLFEQVEKVMEKAGAALL